MPLKPLQRSLVASPPLPSPQKIIDIQRAHPSQDQEGRLWTRAPKPEVRYHVLTFIKSAWVYSAVTRIAELAASEPLEIVNKSDSLSTVESHPLLDLIGEYGVPNDNQDIVEFWELHFTDLLLAGNAYWYWDGNSGGSPAQVWLLDPSKVLIEPATTHTIKSYYYADWGMEKKIHPDRMTHFRIVNPFSRYFGLSPLQALVLESSSDHNMAKYNEQFFGEGVGVPAGILVVPPDTPDSEIQRMEDEMIAQTSHVRRTRIVRADVGATVWHSAGLSARDAEFIQGRLMNRQAIYEVYGIPLGLLSESSTEAHALVAERQAAEKAWMWQRKTASKVTVDALPFWRGHKTVRTRFRDVRRRYVDWRRESFRWGVLEKVLDQNEMRQELSYKPKSEEELNASAQHEQSQSDQTDGSAGGHNQPPAGGDQETESAE